ncbi:hypothetical protein [Pontivivens insulae]|uniref:Uncharacterized protein n=1 Tax=Pontivivens insulae TaxID=1639689 RepID=A0A2R8A9V4_9RHOB|nr:hypothetical protein [Pontivivens insulae]RED12890.1 hypothetical protein DFR53_2023 [Pontivivens insulae]SPF28982.1 hypothetical protein POI8812_01287 [Pontivivens insulae]
MVDQRKWLTAQEFYGTQTDPMRGKRRERRARPANEVRDLILSLISLDEMTEAVERDGKLSEEVTRENGAFRTVRIRTDLIAFISVLRRRHHHHEGYDLSLATVLSLMALYGIRGLLVMDKFKPIKPTT